MQITITPEYLASQGLSLTFPERFWAKVNKTDGCWIWTAYLCPDGYGYIHTKHGRPKIGAHIASWILHVGSVPKGMCVCHNCPQGDTPSCVNPDHLWIGTQRENVLDRDKKGGSGAEKRTGVLNGLSKLNEDQVEQIRSLYAAGLRTQVSLAEEYGVVQTCISRIVLNKIWKHLLIGHTENR